MLTYSNSKCDIIPRGTFLATKGHSLPRVKRERLMLEVPFSISQTRWVRDGLEGLGFTVPLIPLRALPDTKLRVYSL